MVEYGVDPGTSVVKRKDGSKEYYKDNKLVKEESPEGKTVIRVEVGTPTGSKSKKGGSSGSRSKESEAFKVQKAKTASQKMEAKIEKALQKEAQAKEKARVRKKLTTSDIKRFKAIKEYEIQQRKIKALEKKQAKSFEKPEENVFKRIVGSKFQEEVKTRQRDKFYRDLIEDVSKKEKFAPIKKSGQETIEIFTPLTNLNEFSRKQTKTLKTKEKLGFFEKSIVEKIQAPKDYLIELLRPSETELATQKFYDSTFKNLQIQAREVGANYLQTTTDIKRSAGKFVTRAFVDPFVGASILSERKFAKKRGDEFFTYPQDPFLLFTKRPGEEEKLRKIKVEGFDVVTEPEVIELIIAPITELGGEFLGRGAVKVVKKISPFVDDLTKAAAKKFDDVILETRRIKRGIPKNVLDQPFDENLLVKYEKPSIKKERFSKIVSRSEDVTLDIGEVSIKQKVDIPEFITETRFRKNGAFEILDPQTGKVKEFQSQLIKDKTTKFKEFEDIDFSLFDYDLKTLQRKGSDRKRQKILTQYLDGKTTSQKGIVELKNSKIDKVSFEVDYVFKDTPTSQQDPIRQLKLTGYKTKPKVIEIPDDVVFFNKPRTESPRRSGLFSNKKGQSSISLFSETDDSISLIEKRSRLFKDAKDLSPNLAFSKEATNSFKLTKTIPLFDTLRDSSLVLDKNLIQTPSSRMGFNIVTRLDIKNNLDNLFDTSQKSINSLSFDTSQTQDLRQIQRQDFSLNFDSSLIQESKFDFDSDTRKKSKPEELDTDTKFKFPKRNPDLDTDLFQRAKGKVKGYYAEVKEKGKFVRVNKKPLSIKNSRSAMSRALDNTPARTGRLRFSNSFIDKPKTVDSYFSQNRNELRKTKSGLFIEKARFAIDSKGERQGITVKGWLAKRNKKTKKKWGL